MISWHFVTSELIAKKESVPFSSFTIFRLYSPSPCRTKGSESKIYYIYKQFRRALKIKALLRVQILVDFLGGEGSRNDLLTFYYVNLSSGPKIPKGNFSLELIFTM